MKADIWRHIKDVHPDDSKKIDDLMEKLSDIQGEIDKIWNEFSGGFVRGKEWTEKVR